jgi:hypothetical protein
MLLGFSSSFSSKFFSNKLDVYYSPFLVKIFTAGLHKLYRYSLSLYIYHICLKIASIFCLLGQTRRYPRPKSEKNKKIFTIFNSLFYNDLSSLTQYSSRFTRYEFGPNAQLRPIVERRSFPAPSDIV